MLNKAIRTLTKLEARQHTAQVKANVAKRVKKLEAQGIVTKDMAEFAKLKNAKPQTRNEWVKLASDLERIDAGKGTRAATAPKQYRREQTSANNRKLLADTKDFTKLRSMSVDELTKARNLRLKSLRGKADRVRAQYGGTHATKKLEEQIKRIQDTPNPTRNQVMSHMAKLNNIEEYEGIDTKGAATQQQRGVDHFGERYKDYDIEEQTAVWDYVYKTMEVEVVSSTIAVEYIKNFLRGDLAIEFHRDDKGVLRAEMDSDADEAKRKSDMQQAKRKQVTTWIKDAPEPLIF